MSHTLRSWLTLDSDTEHLICLVREARSVPVVRASPGWRGRTQEGTGVTQAYAGCLCGQRKMRAFPTSPADGNTHTRTTLGRPRDAPRPENPKIHSNALDASDRASLLLRVLSAERSAAQSPVSQALGDLVRPSRAKAWCLKRWPSGWEHWLLF